ncbi:unnamed protein product [Polarella glacialis]|uniref:RING-CH-type domain-containing protein n=1 Tax=Polarella glacialis TaxID=89957 RepID=A0A813GSJ1_POLGL|nr:unnamed protein product [Polarella glacialis]
MLTSDNNNNLAEGAAADGHELPVARDSNDNTNNSNIGSPAEEGVLGKGSGSSAFTKDQPECFVCIEAGADLLRGCACRGTSAGFVHLQCLVEAAQANRATWFRCPTCKQEWTGRLGLGIARARYSLVAEMPEEDEDRLDAAMDLTRALSKSGDFAEALQLGHETLTTLRRVSGEEHEDTLRAMSCLAYVHFEMCDEAEALPLETEILAVKRRMLGNDHPETLAAIANLAATYADLSHHDVALPLLTESLEGERRTRGSDHTASIIAMNNLATLHMHMGNAEEALPLYTESVERNQRLLGSQHPNTLFSIGSLGCLLYFMGDHAEAVPLLEDSIVGLTLVYGEAHPHVVNFQERLDSCVSDMADSPD